MLSCGKCSDGVASSAGSRARQLTNPSGDYSMKELNSKGSSGTAIDFGKVQSFRPD